MKRNPPKVHIVSVAVNDYLHDDDKLQHSVKDQFSLIETFRKRENQILGGYEIGHIIDLKNEEVNEDRLQTEFNALRNGTRILEGKTTPVEANDIFILHVSGHGKLVENEYYFLPYDYRPKGTSFRLNNRIKRKGIPFKSWANWLNGIYATRSVLIFDTCETGKITDIINKHKAPDEAITRFNRKTGRALIAASSATGIAYEGYNGHSVLTYSFLEALYKSKLQNGGIRINEVTDNIIPLVKEYSRQITTKSGADPYTQEANVAKSGTNFIITEKNIKGDIDFGYVLISGEWASREPIEIFEEPNASHVIGYLKPLNVVKLVSDDGVWVKIKTRRGKELGYVRKSDLVELVFDH